MNLPWAACAIGSLVLSSETILPATDCNANGQEDAEDIASGRSQDCNQNQVPDECDVQPRINFISAQRLPLGRDAYALVAVDLDGDRTPEVAVTLREPMQVAIIGKVESGELAVRGMGPAPRPPRALVAVDLDGDGIPDLA